MNICLKCHQNISADLLKNGVCVMCEKIEQDTVEKLRARILELETELQKQKASSEKHEQWLKVTRGDNFNNDSLH